MPPKHAESRVAVVGVSHIVPTSHMKRATPHHNPMDQLNQTTLQNLFSALDAVYTTQNLLVVTKSISSLLNYLTPFSVVKERGKFSQLLWLDELPSQQDFDAAAAPFESIIVLVPESQDMRSLQQLWKLLGPNRKVALIVKDLSRSFYYTLNRELFGVQDGLLEKSSELDLDATLRVSPNVRLLNWRANPVLVEDFIILNTSRFGAQDPPASSPSQAQKSGLWSYLHNPLECVSSTLESVMKVVQSVEERKNLIKFKNAFAKGDHASLFVNLLLNEKVPEYLLKTFSAAERDFFLESLSPNADLVVLERNLDYFPLILSPMTYAGLLSELYLYKDGEKTSEFYNSTVFAGDEVFNNAKDLNFSSIGANLNKLARLLKSEVETSGSTDLSEIRQLVSNLGNLKHTQDLIRKHTSLSESILSKIKHDTESAYSHDFREKWLEAQNQIFDQDYKTQLKTLASFLNGNFPFEVVCNLITLISLTNDGIRAKDLEHIETQISLNYGLTASVALVGLLENKIIRINKKGNDFFGNFSFGFGESETTTTSTMADSSTGATPNDLSTSHYDDLMSLGISGGQDVYKSTYTLISKFWNLRPEEDEYKEKELVVNTIKDYPDASFTLPGGTVPLLPRLVESLYFRDFLKYRPTNNIYKRPNWANLNMDTMFKGQTVDLNLEDKSNDRKSKNSASQRQQYLLVVVLGGLTRAEISTFKYLQTKLDQKLYIVTSEITNNAQFYEALQAC